MTTEQAAVALGITTRRVRMLIAEGVLQATKEGRDWHITQEAIEAAQTRNRKPGRRKA